MINLKDGTIVLGDKIEQIKRYEVWFQTPTGLVVERQEAVQLVTQNEWPEHVVRAVPVAISDTLYEVMN